MISSFDTEIVCFGGDSIVPRPDGTWTKMADLVVGDQVLVLQTDIHGYLHIRPSLLLAMDIYQDHDPLSPISYRKISTTKNHGALHITSEHSLLIKKRSQNHAQYQFAAEAEVGDILYMIHGDQKTIEEVHITQIDDVYLFDAYAPLTLEGNLVVNHLVVSCYGTFTHSTGHLVKMFRRWFLHIFLHITLLLRSFLKSLLPNIIDSISTDILISS